MIISFKHRFIYIKNRKVGGTSLERYLIEKLVDKKTDIHTGSIVSHYESNNIKSKDGSDITGHLTIFDISKILKKTLQEILSYFFIFCIERNSYDKCVSAYNFHKTKNNYSFLDFLKTSDITHIPKDWGKYALNKNIIGTVFQYQEFDKTFNDLNFYLNLKNDQLLSLKQFNSYQDKAGYSSKNKKYQEYYNEESKTIVKEIFKEEIYRFKYNF